MGGARGQDPGQPLKAHPGTGHRQRLREKFLDHGLGKFTDEEVLELLLTLATPRRDCKQQARALLKALGSLRGVLEAAPKLLGAVPGVGPKNILGLKLVPAVARRYLEDRLLTMGRLGDGPELADYLLFSMAPLTQEVFRVFLLDAQRRVRATEDLFSGTLDQAVVYPREVVARALAAGAAALICAHNHPGGESTPSAADRDITRQLYHACRGVSLELVDHLVVGREGIYSFAQTGELKAWAVERQSWNI
ncbi:MAG: DNA repair protein RadC [Desulfarculus sp.]|nr:DNA repair protein RadC [Desulfarculus sp.]